jgi:hypothetical protein
LYQFAALEDVERIDGLLAEGDALVQAFRVNAAFAKPSTLEAEWRRYKARLRRKPLVGMGAPGDEERAAVRELLAAIAEANARKDAGEPVPAEVT